MSAVQLAYCDYEGKIGYANKNPKGGTVLCVGDRRKLRRAIEREAPEGVVPGFVPDMGPKQLTKVIKAFQQKNVGSLGWLGDIVRNGLRQSGAMFLNSVVGTVTIFYCSLKPRLLVSEGKSNFLAITSL